MDETSFEEMQEEWDEFKSFVEMMKNYKHEK